METTLRATIERRLTTAIATLALALFLSATSLADDSPTPLLATGKPVDWWFVFKLNTAAFPGCAEQAKRDCRFGGEPQEYRLGFSQQYLYASSAEPTLAKGDGCVGTTLDDPVGATFAPIFEGEYHYVVWNDQFYEAPEIKGCGKSCASPWGHSKGVVAWNDAGEGVVMQVTTPSWPASGNRDHPRTGDGNTLGCVLDDNLLVSQHMFALRLAGDDLEKLLKALANASVVTDTGNPQLVNNGGPDTIQALVVKLGHRVKSDQPTHATLSTGVQLIAKPSKLHVPPWQLVSATLGGPDLRVASWWTHPEIPSTGDDTPVGCWRDDLGKPGAVVNATEGSWNGIDFGLTGGLGKDHNHAKFGVTTEGERHYAIFGDMNQQGALSKGVPEKEQCHGSQNGRGGTFFVVESADLNKAIRQLIGDTH